MHEFICWVVEFLQILKVLMIFLILSAFLQEYDLGSEVEIRNDIKIIVSNVGNRSRGRPESSNFNSYFTEM